METAKEYYTLINKINLLWREDKSRIQFLLLPSFFSERERGQSHMQQTPLHSVCPAVTSIV